MDAKGSSHEHYRTNKVVHIHSIAGAYEMAVDSEISQTAVNPELWEIVYVERGSVQLEAEHQTMTLEANSMVLQRQKKYTLRRTSTHETPFVSVLSFSSASAPLHRLKGKKLLVNVHNRRYIGIMLRECQQTYRSGTEESRQSLRLKADPLLGGEQTVMNRLEVFLIELLREEQRRGSTSIVSKEAISNKTVLMIMDMLENRLYEKITLNEISDSISYSKSYLSRLFHSVCGYSIMEYYVMIKIEEAKRLIRETDANFSQISERLRFDNPHYFSIVFKRVTGTTPSDYARTVRRS